MKTKVFITVIVAATIVAVIALALGHEKVSFHEVWGSIREARVGFLLLTAATATFSFVLRVPRWRLLLKTTDDVPAKSSILWHGIAVGFMANNILPLRAGEFLRAATVTQLGATRMTVALSSLVTERLFDALSLLAFLAVGLATTPLPPNLSIREVPLEDLVHRIAVAPAILLALCLTAFLFPRVIIGLIERIFPPGKVANTLIGIVNGVREGLTPLTSPMKVLGATGWSLVHWLNNGLSFWFCFKAFDIDLGFGPALLLQSLMAVAIAALPIPGYFGVFEVAVAGFLTVLGVPVAKALGYALGYHLITYFPITILGAWSLWNNPISLKGLLSQRSTEVRNA